MVFSVPHEIKDKLVMILDPKGPRRMPPLSLQIYLSLYVALTFDLLNPKFERFMPLPIDYLCQIASKSVHSFSKYRVHKIPNGLANDR